TYCIKVRRVFNLLLQFGEELQTYHSISFPKFSEQVSVKYLPQPPAIPKSKTIAMLPYPLASFLAGEANSVIST
ncbi:hypothetical protein, partial [uncultured Dialister sp.]|uniref:hypothetical protein n=1 Tax=uncultured Dialister sp. TaxID=278064 RepID=UPI002676E3DE